MRHLIPGPLRDRVAAELPPLFRQQQVIIGRLQTYLREGGNPSLMGAYGAELLHMVSCYEGAQDLIPLLTERYRVNTLTIDERGFVPGDYLRMALVKGVHSYSHLKSYSKVRID